MLDRVEEKRAAAALRMTNIFAGASPEDAAPKAAALRLNLSARRDQGLAWEAEEEDPDGEALLFCSHFSNSSRCWRTLSA
jgi:hypothetical protein